MRTCNVRGASAAIVSGKVNAGICRRKQELFRIVGDIPSRRRDGEASATAARMDGSTLNTFVHDAMKQDVPSGVGVIRATDPGAIHLRPLDEIIDRAHPIPSEPSRRAFADQRKQAADYAMFERRRQQLIEPLSARLIVLPALALTDGIVGQDHESVLH